MLPSPDANEIAVAREALATDASRWRSAADSLAAISQVTASLSLTGFHLGYLPTKSGVPRLYDAVQADLVRLFAEGAGVMNVMAEALEAALKRYDSTDTFAAEQIRMAGDGP